MSYKYFGVRKHKINPNRMIGFDDDAQDFNVFRSISMALMTRSI